MSEQSGANLVKLSRSTLVIDDPRDAVRGRQVVTVDGKKIGEVDDLLIDKSQNKVRSWKSPPVASLASASTSR